MEKNLIIVAGGLNTRYKELSNFAKVILPFILNDETTTCLKNSYTVFDDFNKYVIVDSKFYKQVCNYIKSNGLNITCIESFDHTNSFNTIYSCLDRLPNENLLFLWSDIILNTKINLTESLTNCIFTKPGNYRYMANKDGLTRCDSNGNVPGVYYIKDKSTIKRTSNYADFVELFNDIEFETRQIRTKLLELRDKDVYLSELKSNSNSEARGRYFNSFTVNKEEGTITKVSDKEHEHLIQKEVLWYNKVSDLNISPKLLSNTNNSMTISYLDGYNNFYKVLNESNSYLVEKLINLLRDIFNKSEKIKPNVQQFFTDMKVELYDKVLDRINSIKDMLLDYDEADFNRTIRLAFAVICNHFNSLEEATTYYTTFHGDLNGSNTMISGEDFKFIDPRGYFGKTVGSGPLFYEIAKVYYCVSGYDDFNASINYLYYNAQNYTHPKPLIKLDIDPYYRLVVGIIWVCLASYIADNIMKVNISYQFGLKMIKDALKSVNNKCIL